jgi:hypothetical protein
MVALICSRNKPAHEGPTSSQVDGSVIDHNLAACAIDDGNTRRASLPHPGRTLNIGTALIYQLAPN